ncbi:MAG: hypothetical protein PHF74_03040 [Dehalococcoidales bacterium]|nr:hypothetical protein [Dehalococcoidales bacterium]
MAIKRLIVCLMAALTAFVIIPYANGSIAESATNIAGWQQANIPAPGAEHGWLLAAGSDITCLAADSNGIIYAGVSGMPSNLYKSLDDGQSWQAIASGSDTIADMVVTADDTLYYATSYSIYKSVNDVNTVVASLSGSLTDPDTVITSIDVSLYNGSYAILVGTKNKIGGQFGGVYVIYSDGLMQWQNLGLAGCDIYSVGFSPRFPEDNFIVALASDETHTFVTWKEGGGAWGGTIGNAVFREGGTGNPVVLTETAKIAFPEDYRSDVYSDNCVLYAALNTGTGNGDVYAVYGRQNPGQSIAEDLDVAAAYGQNGIDISGLAVCGSIGDIRIMAGASSNGNIYISPDGGNSWQQNRKSPSGEQVTAVLMSADYKNDGKAYSATTGSESAFSLSHDYGINWNQCGLIDTTLDVIIGAAVSPMYDNDETVFLLSWGNGQSVWRTTDGCASWQRVFYGAADSFINIDKIALSPQYGNASHTLYFCGSDNGNATLWKSDDKGQSFFARSMPFAADCWEIIDDSSFYIAGFDGANALLYRTVDSGAHYKYKSIVGNQSLTSIALSPNYSADKTVLAGNCNGGVYLSTNEGISFTPLGNASSLLKVSVSVAFDADYEVNNTVYAAGDMANNGIYRFVIGETTAWEAIDGTLPPGAMTGNLKVSQSGVLYGVNYQQVGAGGGIERSIDPSSAHFFETFTGGLGEGATLTDLWLSGNTLWSIDTTHNLLLFFKDTLSQQVGLSSPSDNSIVKGMVSESNIRNVLLDWEALEGAGSYRWQISDSRSFSSSSIIAEGTTTAGSVKLNSLETGNVYYWRIRAVTPLLSPWSEIWSFTPQAIIEPDAPVLLSPAAGAVNVPVNTMFQWTAVYGADSYELEISTQYDFASPVIQLAGATAIPLNAWQNPDDFTHNTTYYWRVRAINADTVGSWSGAGVFATIAADLTQTSTSSSVMQTQSTQTLASFTTVEKTTTVISTGLPTITIIQTQGTSAPVQQTLTIPDWLYYALGFMALLIVLLVAAILVIVAKRR